MHVNPMVGAVLHEETEVMPSKKPAELSNADGAASSDSQAARRESKWEEHFDEDSRRTYYHHEETGETTWEKPADLLPDNGSESSAGSDSDLEKRNKRENERGAKGLKINE